MMTSFETSTPLLRIESLVKDFGAKRVLDRLSLSVFKGERLALVGQNGCGKTTLIRCLLGLYTYQGLVRVEGLDPRLAREQVLRRVAFVPQSPPALRSTVAEFLSLTTKLCSCREEAIEENARFLGLDLKECRTRPFKNLSGGMKQKLLIAAAIARKPSVLIMDEPAANLDPPARARFFELLGALPTETAMLLSSHRIDELSGLVNRLVELDAGKLLLDDIVSAQGETATSKKLLCQIQFLSMPEAIQKNLRSWGFVPNGSNLSWKAVLAAPDRFRFLAMATRWSALISALSIEDDKGNSL